ncbi:MAG: glycosyltransferase involved in cell wall biosynthesis, partial [Verrucomicrobiales bacterium]
GESVSPIDGQAVAGPEAIDDSYDAAVVQGRVLLAHPELIESPMALAIDWFDPFHVEALHRSGRDRIHRLDLIEGARLTLREQAERGDFFLCSNNVQREHWLGWLASAGRLNHLTHGEDPLFESLLAVAPFGIGRERPGGGTPLRDAFPIIGKQDPVLLWAGGLHDWLDPLSIIRAMPTVLEENPDARLVFLAGPHPNTSIETMGVRGEAISLSRQMRMFGKNILFVNQWVEYGQRLAWLNDATIGVIADRDHLESRYSHRTRLLDHLTVGLPTVSTVGDPLSAQLAAVGAAVTTERSPESIGATLASLVNDDDRLGEISRAARSLAASVTWEETLAPLVAWLDDPMPAVDRRAGALTAMSHGSTLDRLGDRVKLHLDDGGIKQVAQRGFAAGRRRLGR